MTTLVTIATYHSQPQAEAARVRLAHDGIHAVLLNETIVAMDWLLMNAIGGIKLQVSAQDVERATEIINKLELELRERLKTNTTHFIRFQCSECNAPQEFTADRRGGVETCTKCGKFIDVPEVPDEQLIERQPSVEASPDASIIPNRRFSLPVEVGCVLSFAYLPHLLNAVLPSDHNYVAFEITPEYHMKLLIYNMLHVVPALLLIIAASNEPWSKFGIVRLRWVWDPSIALGILFLSTFAMVLTLKLLLVPHSELSSDTAVQRGWGAVLLCLVGFTANSVAEELAMRGYLIPRFEEMIKSSVVAVGLSSALFASYHLYQGVQNAIAIFMCGIVYGMFFCFFRRLWPLVIAHTLGNLINYLSR